MGHEVGDALQHAPGLENKSRKSNSVKVATFAELRDDAHEDAAIAFVNHFSVVALDGDGGSRIGHSIVGVVGRGRDECDDEEKERKRKRMKARARQQAGDWIPRDKVSVWLFCYIFVFCVCVLGVGRRPPECLSVSPNPMAGQGRLREEGRDMVRLTDRVSDRLAK